VAAVRLRSIAGLAVGGALLNGCAVQHSLTPSSIATHAERSILVSSNPAAGSTSRAPVETLELHFNPPAQLNEVTVTGPDGIMPTMIHPVGDVPDYSIPLSGLGPGAYTVNWRATAQQREYFGSFEFAVS